MTWEYLNKTIQDIERAVYGLRTTYNTFIPREHIFRGYDTAGYSTVHSVIYNGEPAALKIPLLRSKHIIHAEACDELVKEVEKRAFIAKSEKSDYLIDVLFMHNEPGDIKPFILMPWYDYTLLQLSPNLTLNKAASFAL